MIKICSFILSIVLLSAGCATTKTHHIPSPQQEEFFSAVSNGNLDKVKEYIAANSEIKNTDESGMALMLASHNGHKDLVKFLLDSKITDINKQNIDGDTALIWATWKGHINVVQLLIEKGAKLDLKDDHGNTALMEAVREGHIEIAKLLISHKTNINAQNHHGSTPIMWAAYYHHANIAQLLIDNHADINIKNNDKKTALMIAKEREYQDIVNIFSVGVQPIDQYSERIPLFFQKAHFLY